MKKYFFILLSLGMFLASANAGILDLRHSATYSNGDAHHYDRLKITHRFANNIGFFAEAKVAHHNETWFNDNYNYGHEVGVSYRWKINDNLTLTPQIALDTNDENTLMNNSIRELDETADNIGIFAQNTYKLQITGNYKVTNNWNLALTYKYANEKILGDGYYRSRDGSTSTTPYRYLAQSLADLQNTSYQQFNITNYYRYRSLNLRFKLDLQFIVFESSQTQYLNAGNHDHSFNLLTEYEGFSGWIPYFEFGIVTVASGRNLDNSIITTYRSGNNYEPADTSSESYDIKGQSYKDTYAPRYRIGVKFSM